MNKLFDSKLVKDLADGNLPVIQVEITRDTIINLCIGLGLVMLLGMIVNSAVKKW